MYKVYIIRSLTSDKFYIGVTSDIKQRLRHHNSGANRSTKGRGPWKLVYYEELDNKESAWKRERQMKNYKGGEAFKKLLNNGRIA